MKKCTSSVLKADLLKPIPLPSKTYDVLTCVGVTTYIEPLVIRDWCKVVKKGEFTTKNFKYFLFPQMDSWFLRWSLQYWANGKQVKTNLRRRKYGSWFTWVNLFTTYLLLEIQVRKRFLFLFIKICNHERNYNFDQILLNKFAFCFIIDAQNQCRSLAETLNIFTYTLVKETFMNKFVALHISILLHGLYQIDRAHKTFM